MAVVEDGGRGSCVDVRTCARVLRLNEAGTTSARIEEILSAIDQEVVKERNVKAVLPSMDRSRNRLFRCFSQSLRIGAYRQASNAQSSQPLLGQASFFIAKSAGTREICKRWRDPPRAQMVVKLRSLCPLTRCEGTIAFPMETRCVVWGAVGSVHGNDMAPTRFRSCSVTMASRSKPRHAKVYPSSEELPDKDDVFHQYERGTLRCRRVCKISA